MTDHTPILTREVEHYVYIRTGKRVKIVVNDAQRIRKHLILLGEAYAVAMFYKKNHQTFK